jgi:hypothetical protein
MSRSRLCHGALRAWLRSGRQESLQVASERVEEDLCPRIVCPFVSRCLLGHGFGALPAPGGGLLFCFDSIARGVTVSGRKLIRNVRRQVFSGASVNAELRPWEPGPSLTSLGVTRAGRGKTTLSVVRAALESQGYAVEGSAPTSRAARQLAEAGVDTATLQGFLARGTNREASEKKHFYFVDESSLASTNQMREFLVRLGAQDRVLLIGDMRQHQGVEAGRPFEQLQQAGMRTAHLDEIVRQKDPALKSAVEDLANRPVFEALLTSARRFEPARCRVRHRIDCSRIIPMDAVAHRVCEASEYGWLS